LYECFTEWSWIDWLTEVFVIVLEKMYFEFGFCKLKWWWRCWWLWFIESMMMWMVLWFELAWLWCDMNWLMNRCIDWLGLMTCFCFSCIERKRFWVFVIFLNFLIFVLMTCLLSFAATDCDDRVVYLKFGVYFWWWFVDVSMSWSGMIGWMGLSGEKKNG